MSSFFSADDHAAREQGGQVRSATEEAYRAAWLQAVEAGAVHLLPQALEQIRQDYRAGKTQSVINFRRRDYPSWENAGCIDVANRLLELITQQTGLANGTTLESGEDHIHTHEGQVFINL